MASRPARRSLPAISLTASICVVILLLVIAWNATRQTSVVRSVAEVPDAASENTPSDGSLPPVLSEQNAAASSDLAGLGVQVVGVLAAQYADLKQKGAYTPEIGAAVATQLAPSVKAPVSYRSFSVSDIATTQDSSYARMQKYQRDLKTALAPLSKNTTPEIAIFSQYVQTKDQKYFDQLKNIAQAYADAASAAAQVTVPRDALAKHVAILNAMAEFSATLDALADNAGDAITTMALLQTYNQAESDMVVSFNSFASYVQDHPKT